MLSIPLQAQTPLPTPSLDRAAGTERIDAFGIAQVWVPAGTFLAGSTQQQADDAYRTCVAN